MIDIHAIPWGLPLAHTFTYFADRRLTLRQRRWIARGVRAICVQRRWHLVACNAGQSRVVVVMGGAAPSAWVQRTVYELCEATRPDRAWDSIAPMAHFTESEVVEACTLAMYERTDGVLLLEPDQLGP